MTSPAMVWASQAAQSEDCRAWQILGSRARRRSAAAILVAVVLAAGCQPAQPTARTARTAGSGSGQAQRDLSRAFDFLDQLEQYEREQALVQVTAQLNRWISTQDLAETWRPDPFVESLPSLVRNGAQIRSLGRWQFQPPDARVIMEAVWARRLSQWVSRRPVEGPLGAAVEREALALGGADGDRLVTAYRLFDWTVRGLQATPLLDYPADPVAAPDTEGPAVARKPPPMRGLPGPGYQFYPWQTMLYGWGDAWQRARVFHLLARQQGLEAFVLALPGRTSPPRPRPWASGVLIGEHIYLFDPQLGLPVPAPDGRWVARLDDLLDAPEHVRTLDVGDEFRYAPQPRELDQLTALIDAPATTLSRRMQRLESALSGERRLALTTHPTQLAERLQTRRGIRSVELWSVPFETTWFRRQIEQRLETDRQLQFEYFRQFSVFDRLTDVLKGRYLHLRGQLEKDGGEEGAKSYYLRTRVAENALEQIESSAEVRAQFGLDQIEGESDTVWRTRVAGSKILMIQSKQHGTYWLGLAHFDSGRFDPALVWLQKRTLEATPDGPWEWGARYNVGRTHEAQGNISAAREVYLADNSPQTHGNLLRARMLRRWITSGDAP